ncbi:hypothetical protein BJX63DRAFT_252979 [Aspergillus granulosus]|uniref:Secreted protein n=1 Tax=Aspergillus granulosus TaxID=176169 RepID=A0ABR4HZX3_9EURO
MYVYNLSLVLLHLSLFARFSRNGRKSCRELRQPAQNIVAYWCSRNLDLLQPHPWKSIQGSDRSGNGIEAFRRREGTRLVRR